MGCGSCSTGGGCTPAGCKGNGSCLTNGCSKLDVYDWLSNMDMPSNYRPFNIVEVKFKGSRKDFYINYENHYLENGELVAVETQTGGYDIGHVSITGELVRMQLKKRHLKPEDVTKKILRKATSSDVDRWKAAKDLEWETMHRARKLALDLGLSMKLSDVDYQGDKTKATFYYTAEGRVDFRELIKKMAEAFRIRIEMRQIGMRQEASRLGGIGSCGRELCCATWLTDFKTVSTAAARYQNLSLNTLKLAGQCGKLKCCLNYELDTYIDALKDIPDNIDRLETEKGMARLEKTDIFKKLMWFSYPNEESWIALDIQRVREIHRLNKEGVKPEDLKDLAVEEETTEVAKILDYENVVGQDSLTRLDEKARKKKKRNRSKSKGTGAPVATDAPPPTAKASSPAKPAGGNKPEAPANRQAGNRGLAQQGGPRTPPGQAVSAAPGGEPKQGDQQGANKNPRRKHKNRNSNRPKPNSNAQS